MIIAITGGIGAGKSTVVDEFVNLGAIAYKADLRADKIMHEDEKLRKDIIQLFGDEAYSSKGLLNRPYISNLVFTRPDLLQKLNALVHPLVRLDLEGFIKDNRGQCIVYESALIKEEDAHRFDYILFVDAPESTRVERVMKRSQLSEKEILDRIKTQSKKEDFLRFSDFFVENLELSETKRQIKNIYAKLNC